jgi:HEAT repeat protein
LALTRQKKVKQIYREIGMNSLPHDLASRLQNPIERIRYDALKELVSLQGREAISTLLQMLNDPGPKVRALAISHLGALDGVNFANALLPFLADEDTTVQKNLVEVLRTIGEYVESRLIQEMSSTNPTIRANVAKALNGLKSKEAVRSLISALKDEALYVRAFAAESLGASQDSNSVEPLIGLLNDPSVVVRGYAIESLGILKDTRAYDPLIRVLSEEEEGIVRRDVIVALGELGEIRAIEPLLAILLSSREDEEIKELTATALGFLGQAGIDALREASRSEDRFTRDLANDTLEWIETKDDSET